MTTNFFKKATLMFVLALMAGFTVNAQTVELVFVDHLKAGMIEQDVFIEKLPGSGQIYRVTPDEKSKFMDAPIYTSAAAQAHDPFNARNAGPCNIGSPMNMTLREWLSAEGTATYKCEDGWGVLEAKFSNLVPNATYTMWHFFMAKGIADPFPGTLDLPVGDRDGNHAVFVTDEHGNGKMEIRFERCLQLSDNQLMSGLAIAYHSDGKTYGVFAGPFGKYTHVQLFAAMPEIDDVTP